MHDRAHLGVGGGLVERRDQLAAELAGPGVERVGAVHARSTPRPSDRFSSTVSRFSVLIAGGADNSARWRGAGSRCVGSGEDVAAMELLPKTITRPVGRLGAAAQNALEVARFGGLATDEEPSPYEVAAEHRVYRLRHYYPGRRRRWTARSCSSRR